MASGHKDVLHDIFFINPFHRFQYTIPTTNQITENFMDPEVLKKLNEKLYPSIEKLSSNKHDDHDILPRFLKSTKRQMDIKLVNG